MAGTEIQITASGCITGVVSAANVPRVEYALHNFKWVLLLRVHFGLSNQGAYESRNF